MAMVLVGPLQDVCFPAHPSPLPPSPLPLRPSLLPPLAARVVVLAKL
jgi:hypothetical protein